MAKRAETFQFQALSENLSPERMTFMEAWNDMYEWVKGKQREGNISYQVLETAIWIEHVSTNGLKFPIMFYDARDEAITKHGWKHNA